MTDITFVYRDDWMGIYDDAGEIVYQNNDIEYDILMQKLEDLGMLRDGLTWENIRIGQLVFALHNDRLPRTLAELNRCNTGLHAIKRGDNILIYRDGELVQKLDKATYELVKEVTGVNT